MKKLTFKKVKKRFKDGGCELLEKIYINSNTKMKYRCSCGNISSIRLYEFSTGQRCRECAKEKIRFKLRFSYKYVKDFFKKSDCILLSNIYKNEKVLLDYICSCGNVSKICFSSFKNGNRCNKCGAEKQATRRRYSYQYVKEYFEDHDCILLSKQYKNNREILRYICSCENVSKINFGNFKKGYRCSVCGLEKISGKNNYNYNHNKTDKEREKERKYREYALWRNKVFKRDKYRCCKCFKEGSYLNAHHIEGYAENREIRMDVDNGITWCIVCHKEFHRVYGRGKNNRDQYNEFIKTENFNYV